MLSTNMARRGFDTGSWVERLISEAQAEEEGSPLRVEEFRAGIEQATRYGAERAESVGISSEEAINELIYEERQKNRNASCCCYEGASLGREVSPRFV